MRKCKQCGLNEVELISRDRINWFCKEHYTAYDEAKMPKKHTQASLVWRE